MIHELKLRKIGNSVGVVFPQEVLTVLTAQEGDSLQVTEAADGSIRLTQVSQISAKFDYFCPLTALEPLILLGGACSAPLCADLGC